MCSLDIFFRIPARAVESRPRWLTSHECFGANKQRRTSCHDFLSLAGFHSCLQMAFLVISLVRSLVPPKKANAYSKENFETNTKSLDLVKVVKISRCQLCWPGKQLVVERTSSCLIG